MDKIINIKPQPQSRKSSCSFIFCLLTLLLFFLLPLWNIHSVTLGDSDETELKCFSVWNYKLMNWTFFRILNSELILLNLSVKICTRWSFCSSPHHVTQWAYLYIWLMPNAAALAEEAAPLKVISEWGFLLHPVTRPVCEGLRIMDFSLLFHAHRHYSCLHVSSLRLHLCWVCVSLVEEDGVSSKFNLNLGDSSQELWLWLLSMVLISNWNNANDYFSYCCCMHTVCVCVCISEMLEQKLGNLNCPILN